MQGLALNGMWIKKKSNKDQSKIKISCFRGNQSEILCQEVRNEGSKTNQNIRKSKEGEGRKEGTMNHVSSYSIVVPTASARDRDPTGFELPENLGCTQNVSCHQMQII